MSKLEMAPSRLEYAPGPLYPMALGVQIQRAVRNIQCPQPGIITLLRLWNHSSDQEKPVTDEAHALATSSVMTR
jgi:hypothetical protein